MRKINVFLLIPCFSLAAGATASVRQNLLDQLPLSFEANQGQADPRAIFISREHGYNLYVTAAEVIFQPIDRRNRSIRMQFVGGNRHLRIEALDPLPGKSNYFIGDNPSKWRTNIPTYGRIALREVYPGIDLVLYGNQRQLEYDWVVGPGASPAAIRMRFHGAKEIRLDPSGDLLFQIASAELRQRKPRVLQHGDLIDGNYVVRGNEVAFQVAAYDHAKPLVIDPVMIYSTFLGGSGTDLARAVAVDSSGNVYVTGSTQGGGFPSLNAAQSSFGGGSNPDDAFVTKISPQGALVYSTYLGGTGEDIGYGIAVDASGNAYVTGYTTGSFPVLNAFQPTYGGTSDAFVAKINPQGNAIVYSTYLGGSNGDSGQAIAVDASGNAYVTGFTSGNFPLLNPLQAVYGGGINNAFVTKMNAQGSALIYSSYVGGSGSSAGYGIAVDSSNNAYLTGFAGAGFPLSNPLRTFSGSYDAFVTEINPLGTSFIYSTYVGGAGVDFGTAIAVDSGGNAYVTGYTDGGSGFPLVAALQSAYGGGAHDAFVTKIAPQGTSFVYSTYLGGSGDDQGAGIAVDSSANVYLTGTSLGGGFPMVNALQSTFAGYIDVFVAELNPQGSVLLYSTYLGGTGNDEGLGIAADSNGNAYVIGLTTSPEFPVFQPAQANLLGSEDAFITKIGSNSPANAYLGLVVTHSGNFAPGQQGATYTVKASNAAGAGPTTGTVTVTETLPSGLSLVSMAGTGWSCSANSCTRSDVLAGGSSYPTITVTVNVAANATSPQVNQVTVSGGGAPSATETDSTNIVNPPALAITKTHVGNFTPGQQQATYIVTVSNGAGATPTSGTITVTDTLPSGLTLVSIAGTGWACFQRTCNRADVLNPGSSYPPLTVTVNVASNATSPQVNQVTVSGGGSATATASDSTIIGVAGQPSLSITKSHSGNFSQGQSNANYTIVVSNANGAGPTSGAVTVTETVPSGLSLVSMAGTGWSCAGTSCTRSDALSGGASYPAITVTVNVASNATSPQVNQATVSGGVSASATANDSTTITATPPGLNVNLSHAGNFVQGQQSATYTVTVSNGTGAGPTTGTVTVTDTLPAGLTLVSMSGTGWSCAANSCTRSDTLNGGSSYPAITVSVNVASNATSPQVNQASVSGGGSTSATASDSTTITAIPPGLNVSLSHAGNFVQGQQNATYSVTVSNGTGAGPTSGVVTVTDTLPAGLTLVSVSGTGWSCASNICSRSDSLSGGAGYPVITVTVNVASNATSPQVNQVAVSGGGSASATTTDSTNIVSAGQPSLIITKTHAGNFTQGQQNATYTITVSDSPGAGTTSGLVSVTETMPSGLALVSMAGSGWACSSNVCTRSDALAAGASYPAITVTVNVLSNATSPQVNQVSASGGGSPAVTASDSTIVATALGTLSLNRAKLNFGYSGSLITSTQTVSVNFLNGIGANWTASSNQTNIVVSPTSGSGNGSFQVSVSPGPSGVITVTASGSPGSPQQVQVNVTSVSPAAPFGSFDTPANNSAGIAGAIPVTGWALDNIEISSVGIWREPATGETPQSNGLMFVGTATLVADARPDVQASFPASPWNYRAGWGYMLLTNFLPHTGGAPGLGNGTYNLHAIAVGKAGQTFDLGTRTITVDNADATKPFGTIDTPDQGATASGNAYVNFGWALTQNPRCVATDGSTVTVYVDGLPMGHPAYNQYRSDVATLFPGLCNSNGAIGFFYIDTTKLANGVHTISWVAFDNAGHQDGLGSRYFTVANTGGGNAPAADSSALPANSHGGEVKLRKGYDRSRSLETLIPDGEGRYTIQAEELDLIELSVGASSGYMLVEGQRAPLPVGSTLKSGAFHWQIGPAFLGRYDLVFERPGQAPLSVRAVIDPKNYSSR